MQAALLGVLTIAGLITPELLLVLTLFFGIVTAFNQPARLALASLLEDDGFLLARYLVAR